jgi:hypothetical protein
MGARVDEMERWFIRRGVPHFIDDYDAATDIWTRSLPTLVLMYFVGGLHALDIWEWSWQKNVGALAVVVLVLLACWAITNRIRSRPAFSRPQTVGAPELAVFVLGPAIPSLVFGQWGDALQSVIEGSVVLVLIYVITSYAVLALLGWAMRRSLAQLSALANLVVRALPLLLLFTTFLFINAEVWQVAGTLTGTAYVVILFVFFVLGAVFVLSRLPALMRGLATFASWDEVRTSVEGTPAANLTFPTAGAPPVTPLSRRQQLNAGLVAVFSQALQITFVAVVLFGFFVVFGFFAIPASTASAWTTLDSVHVVATWTLDGRDLVITEPLLRVSAFLGAFTGMYFTVVLSTDATYRDEFAEDVAPQIRQALAARVAYLAHRASRDAATQRG